MRGDLKISPWPIVRAQHETYVDARTGRPRVRDYALFDGSPLVVAGICIWQHVKLNPVAGGALLTASGLLSALLFGVMLQVSERALELGDDPPTPSRDTTEHVMFLRELAATAGYASLVCVAAAIAYVVATTSSHLKLEVATAIGLALGAHLVFVLLMVMKRVFALIENRLMRVRTGADQRVVPHQRRRVGNGPH